MRLDEDFAGDPLVYKTFLCKLLWNMGMKTNLLKGIEGGWRILG